MLKCHPQITFVRVPKSHPFISCFSNSGRVPAAIGKKGSTLDRLSVSCRVYTCAWTWIIASICTSIFFPLIQFWGWSLSQLSYSERHGTLWTDRQSAAGHGHEWIIPTITNHQFLFFVFILTDSSALKWMFQLAGCFTFVWWWMFFRLLIAPSHWYENVL